MVLSQTEHNYRWIAKQSQEKKEQLQEEDRLRAKKNYYKKAKMQNPEADEETVEQIAARLIANNQQNRHT